MAPRKNTNDTVQSHDLCRSEHNMIDYNIQKLLEKTEVLQETVTGLAADVKVLNTNMNDFSYRLRKLEDRDEKINALAQKLELIIQKLEPDVVQLKKDHDSLDTRVTKIETNWGWVVAISGMISGFIVWGVQTLITHLIHVH